MYVHVYGGGPINPIVLLLFDKYIIPLVGLWLRADKPTLVACPKTPPFF
jgi:hypothetical protein